MLKHVLFSPRWPAVCIHGDKSQNERDWVLQGKIDKYDLIIPNDLIFNLLF